MLSSSRTFRLLGLAPLGLLLALGGCGGGGGGGSTPSEPGLAASRVAFQTDRDGHQEIYVMNGDGTGQTRLTNSTTDDFQPCFNRNGNLIAFRAQRDGDDSREIYVMNADGSNQHAVTHNAFDDAEPSFSPLSDTIVYKSARNGQNDIYSLDLATGVEKQLTNDLAFDEDPTYLPDGRVMYASNLDGSFRLYVLTNGVPKALPKVGTESQFFPDVSSTGRVAFVSNVDGNFEIYAMNLDGSNRVRLTNNSVSDVDPVFTTDGKRIYYASTLDGNFNIYEISADGSTAPRRITSQSSTERLPSIR